MVDWDVSTYIGILTNRFECALKIARFIYPGRRMITFDEVLHKNGGIMWIFEYGLDQHEVDRGTLVYTYQEMIEDPTICVCENCY